MDGTLYTIGELAERTGLTVKTIRFYSDAGIVPSTERSAAGYRLYDPDALARLDLVRTLRELGVELAVIRQVLDRTVSLPEVAAAHAEALDAQIHTLRMRRAVARAVARWGLTLEATDLIAKLTMLSDGERRRIVEDFIDEIFGGLGGSPDLMDLKWCAMPELPEDPDPGQVAAWIELAELTQDPRFRAALRLTAEYLAAEGARGDVTGLNVELGEVVRDVVLEARSAGVAPASAQGALIVNDLAVRYARGRGGFDDTDLRRWLLGRLEIANDSGVARYWHLLAVVNGWPEIEEADQ
jgi:DNA-binding transcriptional MerR regulator